MKYLLILGSIALGAAGQLFLKLASMKTTASQEDIVSFYLQLLKTPFTWIGAVAYGLSFLIWMRLLKIFDLSFLRPLVGFGYIVTSLLAMLILKEKISVSRWLGIALIVAGVYLVGTTAKS